MKTTQQLWLLVIPVADLEHEKNYPKGHAQTKYVALTVREINARPLTKESAFWAGQVENWPGQVEFCKEHIRDICFRASAPKI